jgi:prophage antirepressor-like protein
MKIPDDSLEWDYAYERWVDKQLLKELEEKDKKEELEKQKEAEIDELFI